MKAAALLTVLYKQDRENHLWLFTLATFRVLFPVESKDSLKMSLRRHVKSGLLIQIKRGLYANEKARCAPADKLPALVHWLKPGNISYLSQESRLSQLGVISQIPLNYLSLMTNGSSQTFKTPYGTVEFTHTKRPMAFILDHTTIDNETGLLMADAELALRDLMKSNRETSHLVGKQAKKAIYEKVI